MIRQWVSNQRGTVLLFTTALLVLLLVMGGLAVDLFYFATVDNELQRALDFAALAGAGKLAFDDTVFPAVRAAAVAYALANPLRIPGAGPTVTLDPNPGNDPAGNIVLGTWGVPEGSPAGTQPTFTPSLDGTVVNAVKCQFRNEALVPTSFLRLLTINSLPARGWAIAISPIIALPPECPFPFAVACETFYNGAEWNSTGCGTQIQFISSSGQSQAGFNTAGWAIPWSINGSEPNPSANNIRDVINNPNPCGGAEIIPTGGDVVVNGGMQDTSFEALKTKFTEMWNASGEIVVERPNPDGGSDVTYRGKGWAGWVPVVCPGSNNVSGNLTIRTYTKFVITQVIGHTGGNPSLPRPGFPDGDNGKCAVPNSADAGTWGLCDDPISNSYRAVFGYYSCERVDVPPSPTVGPRASLTEKIKLVQ